jgi:hypothetical protein
MHKIHRWPSKDASYQVLIHLANQVSEEKIFYKSTNQKQKLPVVSMFVNGSELNKQSL